MIAACDRKNWQLSLLLLVGASEIFGHGWSEGSALDVETDHSGWNSAVEKPWRMISSRQKWVGELWRMGWCTSHMVGLEHQRWGDSARNMWIRTWIHAGWMGMVWFKFISKSLWQNLSEWQVNGWYWINGGRSSSAKQNNKPFCFFGLEQCHAQPGRDGKVADRAEPNQLQFSRDVLCFCWLSAPFTGLVVCYASEATLGLNGAILA